MIFKLVALKVCVLVKRKFKEHYAKEWKLVCKFFCGADVESNEKEEMEEQKYFMHKSHLEFFSVLFSFCIIFRTIVCLSRSNL